MIESTTVVAAPEVTYRQQYRRCNKADCLRCRGSGRGHGPYWFSYWREGGKQRMRYLGKEMPRDAAPALVPHACLRVRTLGGFTVWLGPAVLPDTAWSQRKQTLLFKCLLSMPGYRLHREQAIELFWPEHEPGQGARLLRQTLYRLRRQLDSSGTGREYVRLAGEHLVLVPDPDGNAAEDWFDALAFERKAETALAGTSAAASRAALALYAGEYLPDDHYEEWAIRRREHLRGRYVALLLQLAGLRERQGAPGEAMRCLQTLLAVDGCHEEAARSLMRMQTAAGRYLEAMRTYRQLVERMRRDLDLTPDRATDAHYQAVLQQRQSSAFGPSNLPVPLTSFVGREEVLRDLSKLLAAQSGPPGPRPRLVTIVGSGGCGKTRLAVELGTELRAHYEGGVWLVELAALPASRSSEMAPILQQVASALELQLRADRSLLDLVRGALGVRPVLLILDNCEHVLEGCVALASALLSACSTLQLLTTSRQALGMLGETVRRLPSLSLPWPAEGASLGPADVSRAAAARLLVERAQAVSPHFVLTAANCRAVAAICRRLDGIPLAIELASARLAVLSAEELERRLTKRFRLLVAGNGAALPRHQTLHAVIDWSYRLLTLPERTLLRMLSVFAGGWTLDAAEAICAGTPVEDAGVVNLLALLSSKSLVEQEEPIEKESRFRLLETLRQYAVQQLQEHGEEHELRTRHLRWCVGLAERAAPALAGPEPTAWLDRLDKEQDNLRAALAWCLEDGGDVEAGLRLAGALLRFWGARGYWHEGRRWLTEVLSREGGTPASRLRALQVLGHLAINQGDHALARAVHEECLALGRALHDERTVAHALNGLGNVARFQGDPARAASLYAESLAMFRRAADEPNIGRALHNLALVAQEDGDYTRAIALNEDALVHWYALGDRVMSGYTRYNQAVCTRLGGDRRRAATLLAPLVELFEETGDSGGGAGVQNELGRIAGEEGNSEQAIAHLSASMRRYRQLGDRLALIDVLQNWAVVVARGGNPAYAARLLGAVEAAQFAIGFVPAPGQRAAFMADAARVRQLLGADDGFEAHLAEGRAMDLDAAVASVLALPSLLVSDCASNG